MFSKCCFIEIHHKPLRKNPKRKKKPLLIGLLISQVIMELGLRTESVTSSLQVVKACLVERQNEFYIHQHQIVLALIASIIE